MNDKQAVKRLFEKTQQDMRTDLLRIFIRGTARLIERNRTYDKHLQKSR